MGFFCKLLGDCRGGIKFFCSGLGEDPCHEESVSLLVFNLTYPEEGLVFF